MAMPLETIEQKTGKDPIEVFFPPAINNVADGEVTPRRWQYQVPVEVRPVPPAPPMC